MSAQTDDTVKVHVGTLEDMGQRFVDAWHRAERGEAVSETHPGLSYSLPDADVLAWFKQDGEGYQTRINAALREYMAQHRPNRG